MTTTPPHPNHSYRPDSFEWIACDGGPAAVWAEAACRSADEAGVNAVTRVAKVERLIVGASRERDYVEAALDGGVPAVRSSLRKHGQPEWLANAVLAENFSHMPLLAAFVRVCRIAEPSDLASIARISHLALCELRNWQECATETDERWELSRGQWRPVAFPDGPRELLRRHARFLRLLEAPRSARGRPVERPPWTNRVDLIYRETVDKLLPHFCMAVPQREAVLALIVEAGRAAAEPLRSEAASLLHDVQSQRWSDDPAYRLTRWGQCSGGLHRLFIDLRMDMGDQVDFSGDADVAALIFEVAASRVPSGRMPEDRRWEAVADLADLHVRLTGRKKPEISITANRPSGATHEFLVLIGRLYKMNLVSSAGADYVRRIGAN